MKATTTYLTANQREEVERFKRTSARLVRAARKDPKMAEQFLREAGYFDIVPEAVAQLNKDSLNKDSARKAARRRRSPSKK